MLRHFRGAPTCTSLSEVQSVQLHGRLSGNAFPVTFRPGIQRFRSLDGEALGDSDAVFEMGRGNRDREPQGGRRGRCRIAGFEGRIGRAWNRRSKNTREPQRRGHLPFRPGHHSRGESETSKNPRAGKESCCRVRCNVRTLARGRDFGTRGSSHHRKRTPSTLPVYRRRPDGRRHA